MSNRARMQLWRRSARVVSNAIRLRCVGVGCHRRDVRRHHGVQLVCRDSLRRPVVRRRRGKLLDLQRRLQLQRRLHVRDLFGLRLLEHMELRRRPRARLSARDPESRSTLWFDHAGRVRLRSVPGLDGRSVPGRGLDVDVALPGCSQVAHFDAGISRWNRASASTGRPLQSRPVRVRSKRERMRIAPARPWSGE